MNACSEGVSGNLSKLCTSHPFEHCSTRAVDKFGLRCPRGGGLCLSCGMDESGTERCIRRQLLNNELSTLLEEMDTLHQKPVHEQRLWDLRKNYILAEIEFMDSQTLF